MSSAAMEHPPQGEQLHASRAAAEQELHPAEQDEQQELEALFGSRLLPPSFAYSGMLMEGFDPARLTNLVPPENKTNYRAKNFQNPMDAIKRASDWQEVVEYTRDRWKRRKMNNPPGTSYSSLLSTGRLSQGLYFTNLYNAVKRKEILTKKRRGALKRKLKDDSEDDWSSDSECHPGYDPIIGGGRDDDDVRSHAASSFHEPESPVDRSSPADWDFSKSPRSEGHESVRGDSGSDAGLSIIAAGKLKRDGRAFRTEKALAEQNNKALKPEDQVFVINQNTPNRFRELLDVAREDLQQVDGQMTIFVPAKATSLLNLVNAETFFVEGKFRALSKEERRNFGRRKPVAFSRQIGGRQFSIRVVDSVKHVQHWKTVCAVFIDPAVEKDWTLDDWPFAQHVQLFAAVRGFALSQTGAPIKNPLCKNCDVRTLNVEEHLRHKDFQIQSAFWRDLDTFLQRRSHMAYYQPRVKLKAFLEREKKQKEFMQRGAGVGAAGAGAVNPAGAALRARPMLRDRIQREQQALQEKEQEARDKYLFGITTLGAEKKEKELKDQLLDHVGDANHPDRNGQLALTDTTQGGARMMTRLEALGGADPSGVRRVEFHKAVKRDPQTGKIAAQLSYAVAKEQSQDHSADGKPAEEEDDASNIDLARATRQMWPISGRGKGKGLSTEERDRLRLEQLEKEDMEELKKIKTKIVAEWVQTYLLEHKGISKKGDVLFQKAFEEQFDRDEPLETFTKGYRMKALTKHRIRWVDNHQYLSDATEIYERKTAMSAIEWDRMNSTAQDEGSWSNWKEGDWNNKGSDWNSSWKKDDWKWDYDKNGWVLVQTPQKMDTKEAAEQLKTNLDHFVEPDGTGTGTDAVSQGPWWLQHKNKTSTGHRRHGNWQGSYGDGNATSSRTPAGNDWPRAPGASYTPGGYGGGYTPGGAVSGEDHQMSMTPAGDLLGLNEEDEAEEEEIITKEQEEEMRRKARKQTNKVDMEEI
ncbi:unnamed protein product [Amoebophrya sp. A25]|nr:unnamed protein product [Amoebophrya sp. A25]|eukprot:GSA25T00019446001.1